MLTLTFVYYPSLNLCFEGMLQSLFPNFALVHRVVHKIISVFYIMTTN